MANDFTCTRCGYKEAPHECAEWDAASYPGICGTYRRSREELTFNRRARRAAEREADARPINHMVLMLTPYGLVDIGS